jgi:hypothetical protein
MNALARSAMLRGLSALLALAVGLPGAAAPAAPAASAEPALAELPLLGPEALAYAGLFRLPHQDSQGQPLGYSGHALGYDPARQGLFLGGHDWYQQLCQVGVPAELGPEAEATLLQDCADVSEGRLGEVDDYTVKLGGTLVHAGQLVVSAYGYYDANGSQVRSHFSSTPELAEAGDVLGPATVGDWAGIVAGYMAPIPAEWQAAFGGPAFTGQCCIAIISRSSAGPALSVFDPADVGRVEAVPAEPVLYYPIDHPLAPETTQNDYYNLATSIVGVAFPPGTRSVLFFGRHGIGPYCYGTGDECGDPVDASKGTHSYPYVHQVWAYDALDLLRVKAGELEPWAVRPYGLWRLDEMDSSGAATVRGAAYDPATGRVFLTEAYGEDPHVHVYTLSTAPPAARIFLPSIRR